MQNRPVRAGRFFLEQLVNILVNAVQMKVLKTILVVLALFFAAMPCTHAAAHHHALPFSEHPDQISGS